MRRVIVLEMKFAFPADSGIERCQVAAICNQRPSHRFEGAGKLLPPDASKGRSFPPLRGRIKVGD